MTQWQQIKAVAFDLDGTLIDSVPDLAAAVQATLAEYNLPSCTNDDVRSWVGNGVEMLMRRALTQALGHEVEQDKLDQAMPRFSHYYALHLEKHSCLYEGVHDSLKQLHQAGFKMAIVTNKAHCFTVPLLKAFDIDGFFDEVLGGDSLAKMKPDPLPLTHLMDKWQLTSSQLLMVGDSRNDILAAKAAGVASIGLTYGYNYGEDIGLSQPTAVCEQFNQILTRLLPTQ